MQGQGQGQGLTSLQEDDDQLHDMITEAKITAPRMQAGCAAFGTASDKQPAILRR